MPSIDTFLQTAYQFIKALFVRVTKRMYRTAAVLMTGAAVVTVIAFNSVSFGGVGKNAASAHREYPDDVELTEMLQSEETTEQRAYQNLRFSPPTRKVSIYSDRGWSRGFRMNLRRKLWK